MNKMGLISKPGLDGRAKHIKLFFFSSRRRHTRFDCDWSSDVCSSDLIEWSEKIFESTPADLLVYLQWPMEVVGRSEEHTSELQSQSNLVCRLLLEKKKKKKNNDVKL